MDIEQAKKIFFKYNGSHMHIAKDLGDQYEKMKVPKEIEMTWKNEILISLYNEILKETGSKRIASIYSYIHLLSIQEGIEFLSKLINEKEMDAFSLIILCEALENYNNKDIDLLMKELINHTIINAKKKMLSRKIDVDLSFKNQSFMKDYDFSEDNLFKRIKKL